MDVAERLATISDRMEELGYSTAQQAEVLKAFGIRGQEMLSLFEGGGKSIRQARDDVKAFGVAVSQIDGVKVEQANDAWTTAMLLFKGIGNQVAVELAPLVKQLGDDFAAAGRELKGFGETIQAGVLAAVRAWGTFSSEIYQFRLDWDENVAHLLDGINKITAGFNSINLAKGLTGEIPQIEHSFGKLRERIGAPPSTEDWDRWFGLIKLKAEMNAADVAAARNKMLGGNGPKTDPLTEEERKQQEQKFLEFQRSLANEDAALGIHREQQLAKLAEFQAKQIGTAAEHAAARLAIEEKYQKDRADLIFAKLEEGVATEQEILLRKHEQQLAAIAEFENNRTITENAAAELRRKYAQKIALDMAQIQARQYSQLAGIVDTAMGHISQVIGDEGGAAFELMKGISIATALVKGYEAVLERVRGRRRDRRSVRACDRHGLRRGRRGRRRRADRLDCGDEAWRRRWCRSVVANRFGRRRWLQRLPVPPRAAVAEARRPCLCRASTAQRCSRAMLCACSPAACSSSSVTAARSSWPDGSREAPSCRSSSPTTWCSRRRQRSTRTIRLWVGATS